MTADDLRLFDEAGYFVLPARLRVPREILLNLEALFERSGENAGHAFRAEPFARSVDIAPDEFRVFDQLTNDAAVLSAIVHLLGLRHELEMLRARSANPFALALGPLRPGPGAQACQVVWLLDDFTEDGAAALRVAPGSHQSDERLAVELSGPAGSAVVLYGGLWCGDAPNPGNRHLRTLRCEYARRETSISG